MKPLQAPDSHYLAAAQGWLGLGNWQEADGEYAKIASALGEHPDVLEVRYLICANAGKWEQALEIATQLTEIVPDRSFGWVQRAFSLNKLNQTKEAYDLLLPVLHRFPKDLLMHYNMACYASRIGNLGDAWNWLDKTFGMGAPKHLQAVALTDPDLQPLWAKMGATHFPPTLALRYLAITLAEDIDPTELCVLNNRS